MGGTPQYQRERLQKQRETQHPNLIPCLECGLSFVRVGSHAVQVHGYKTAWEYRQAHGLNKNETVLPEYQAHMREIAKNEENCHIYGKKTRLKKGNTKAKNYWHNRKKKHQ